MQLEIKLIVDENRPYDDLYLNIPKWGLNARYDTYHLSGLFYQALDKKSETIIDVRKKSVKKYLEFWFEIFVALRINEELILPIGLYDEYSDILKFSIKEHSKCLISLGFIKGFLYSSEPSNFDFFNKQTYIVDNLLHYNVIQGPSEFCYIDILNNLKTSIDNIDKCEIKESILPQNKYPGITFSYNDDPKDS